MEDSTGYVLLTGPCDRTTSRLTTLEDTTPDHTMTRQFNNTTSVESLIYTFINDKISSALTFGEHAKNQYVSKAPGHVKFPVFELSRERSKKFQNRREHGAIKHFDR